MDENGRIAIDPIYDSASRFRDDRASVGFDGGYAYIKTDGRFACNNQSFEDARSFHEGCAEVTRGGRTFLIGTEGNTLSELAYDSYYPISEGLLCV